MPVRLAQRAALFAALLTACASPAAAQDVLETSAGPVAVERVAGPFDRPWGFAFLPGGGVLVTERDGTLFYVENGEAKPVAGAPAVRARGQGGLLDVAVAPDFAASTIVYLTYSEPTDDGARTAAARAEFDASGPRLTGLTRIFGQEPSLSGGRHFGARIVPALDGALYITTGDRGERPLAQDLGGHVGKVVRITPEGAPAPGNPFLGDASVKPEIFSYGHRNIQGAALHPETGALWTVEHGARGGDEINQPKAGLNYGWPVISYGRHYSGGKIGQGTSLAGMEQPEFYWDPSIAPSGLAFYTGDLFPEWRGQIFVGALKFELIARLAVENGKLVEKERLFRGRFGRVRDVDTGPDGALYFLTDERRGGLYRAAPAPRS